MPQHIEDESCALGCACLTKALKSRRCTPVEYGILVSLREIASILWSHATYKYHLLALCWQEKF